MRDLGGLAKRGLRMQYKTQERWRNLCQQASTEQDPERLSLLVAEILRLLDEKLNTTDASSTSKDGRLKNGVPCSSPSAG